MSDTTRMFPLSPGLVDGKHRRNMGLAIWEFLWFLEHVTSDEPDGKGKFGGVVDFGNPISAARIAREIASNARSVQKKIQKLVSTGYVIRRREMANGSSYTVTNSKRWIWKRADPPEIPIPSQKTDEGANDLDAGVRPKRSPDATETVARRERFGRSNKESKSRRAEEQNTPQTSFAGARPTLFEGKSAKPNEVQVEQIYQLYPKKLKPIAAKKSIRNAVRVVMNGDPDHPALPLEDALDYLAQRLSLYARSVQRTDRKYIPHPATWFNGGSFWDDEHEWGDKQIRKSPSVPVNGRDYEETKRINAAVGR